MILLSLVPIVATCIAAAVMGLAVRRRGQIPVPLRWLLVVALAASELVELLWPAVTNTWSAANSLPFQLSDIGTVVAIIGLLRPRDQISRELAYFWGVSSGVLGLVFPAIGASAPSPLYFAFYVDHGTLLSAGILLGSELSLHLGWGSVMRSWTATTAVAVSAGLANLITGGDYMFLRQPPGNWNPLLIMGSWPWYVLTAWAVSPLLFRLLATPIWNESGAASRRRATRGSG
ncbi:MAG: TMEM164-related integral membrane acyltransferase [Candidatus Dormibacteria bacterium]